MTIDPNLLLNILVATIPLIGLGVKLWHSVEMIEYKLRGLQAELDRANREAIRRDNVLVDIIKKNESDTLVNCIFEDKP